MAQIYMIRRKHDGKYISGSSNYPWFSDDMGRTFYSMNSVKIFLTNYMRRKKIKTWEKCRYRFNAGEFHSPNNLLMECEVVTVQIAPTPHKDVFDLCVETEMKYAAKPKKEKKAKQNG
jgi:hypothetical protein